MNTQPFKSKSTLFFERYSQAESQNVQMRNMICLLSGLLGILIIAFAYALTRPRAVYYIPGADSSGMAYPDRVPLSSVESFAISWLMGWMNYTPETIEGVYKRSVNFMAPALLSQVHSRSTQELEKVRRDRLSSVFMIDSQPETEEDKDTYKVTVEGRRGIYMGKEEMSSEPVRYILRILKTSSTDQNPYALAVNDIKREEARHAAK